MTYLQVTGDPKSVTAMVTFWKKPGLLGSGTLAWKGVAYLNLSIEMRASLVTDLFVGSPVSKRVRVASLER